MEETSASDQVEKKRGRGAAKNLKSSRPMFIEFNQYGQHTGEFSEKFGKQIGHCASRVNITYREWKDVPQSLKDSMWEETKVYFLYDLKWYYI